MAIITSQSSGNFTTASTWTGGVVPGANDTAIAGTGTIVTISGTVTCTAIENQNTSGYFVLSDGATLNANVQGGATFANNGVLRYSGTTGATINGNIISSNGTADTYVVDHRGTGLLTINGNVSVNGAGGPSNRYGIYCAQTAGNRVKVTGNVIGGNSNGTGGTGQTAIYSNLENVEITVVGNLSVFGSGGTSYAVELGSAGAVLTVTGSVRPGTGTGSHGVQATQQAVTITINGDVFGATAGSNINALNVTGAGSVTTINGNVTGGGGTSTHGLTARGTVVVTGNVTGGSGTSSTGITGSNIVEITVNGNVSGGTGGTAVGISNGANAGLVRVNGDIIAASGATGCTGGAPVILNGRLLDATSGQQACTSSILQVVNFETYRNRRYTFNGFVAGTTLAAGTEMQMADPARPTALAPSDVRAGVAYAAGIMAGSLQVPPPEAVRAGTDTDGLTGTAAVLADLAAVHGAQIAGALSAP